MSAGTSRARSRFSSTSTWTRPGSASAAPIARLPGDEAEFRALYERRQPLYREVADAVVREADGVVLAAGGGPRRLRVARTARRARPRRRARRPRLRRPCRRYPRPCGPARARRAPCVDARGSARRGGEDARRWRSGSGGSSARPHRDDRGARRRVHHGRGRIRRVQLSPRQSSGSPCRRRSSARSTRRSAARPPSTSPRGRTSSVPSTGLRRP
jgi:hypothetical protein